MNLYDAEKHGPIESDKENRALLNATREVIIYLLECAHNDQEVKTSDMMLIVDILGQVRAAIGDPRPIVAMTDRETLKTIVDQHAADFPMEPKR